MSLPRDYADYVQRLEEAVIRLNYIVNPPSSLDGCACMGPRTAHDTQCWCARAAINRALGLPAMTDPPEPAAALEAARARIAALEEARGMTWLPDEAMPVLQFEIDTAYPLQVKPYPEGGICVIVQISKEEAASLAKALAAALAESGG